MAATKSDAISRTTDAPALKRAELEDLELGSAADVLAFINGLDTGESLKYTADSFPAVEKATLRGVPFALIQWSFGTSDKYAAEYVSAQGVRMDNGEKFTLVDMSTGIKRQLEEVTERRLAQGLHAYNGLIVEKGLRVSEYEVEVNGKTIKAETWYLA